MVRSDHGEAGLMMLASLAGYVEDADGAFAWAAPRSDEVHAFANEIGASVGTYLYGRRMYETLAFWETAHEGAGHRRRRARGGSSTRPP